MAVGERDGKGEKRTTGNTNRKKGKHRKRLAGRAENINERRKGRKTNG